MRSDWIRSVGFALLTMAPPLAASAPSIVVLPFTVGGGIEEKKAVLIDEVYLTELSRVVPPNIKILGAGDVVALLGQAQQQQLSGCTDTACLIEVGNALGTSYLMVSSLGKVGDQFVVNSKFIEVESASVLWREVLYLGATEGELLGGVRQLAASFARNRGWIDAQGERTVARSSLPAATAPAATPATEPTPAAPLSATASAPPPIAADSGRGPGLWFWVGASTCAVGVLAAAGGAVGAVILDGSAADESSAWADRQTAGRLGVGLIALAGVSAAAALAGATLAAWDVLAAGND